jgi:hypothetical protein
MRHLAAATALIALSACAAPQMQPRATWAATSPTALPPHQAHAECNYDVIKDPNNFDRLFLLSGQSTIGPDGSVQGLSQRGFGIFRLCMQAKGYALSGSRPYTP